MARLKTLSSAQMTANAHQALKCLDKRSDLPNPLGDLFLVREARRASDLSTGLAVDDILHTALKMLEATHSPREADLLRLRFQDQATVSEVAARFNIVDSTLHKKQREAIEHLAAILYEWEQQARDDYLIRLESKLLLPPQTPLVGVAQPLAELWDLLTAPDAAWLIAIEGLGGLGKTALANALLREMAVAPHFYGVAWVSAKQQEFWPDLGLRQTRQPALDEESLVDALLEQLGDEPARACPPPQKRAILTGLLKKQPYLIVIDNLETVADYESLLPLLLKLAQPGKFVLTSRSKVPPSLATPFKVKPLTRADTLAFLDQEARLRRLPALAKASPAQLESIYEVVGGNPLALKLVVGQIHALPLSRVLDNLKKARGQTIEELYTYIYWQDWQTLAEAGRHLLVTMPLAQNGALADVAQASGLAGAALDQALRQLIDLSLVEVSGEDVEDRRYHIHRLTETFLLNEVIQWQARA